MGNTLLSRELLIEEFCAVAQKVIKLLLLLLLCCWQRSHLVENLGRFDPVKPIKRTLPESDKILFEGARFWFKDLVAFVTV